MTDRRTDVKPIAITCFSIADARKNHTTQCHKNLHKDINNLGKDYCLCLHQEGSNISCAYSDPIVEAVAIFCGALKSAVQVLHAPYLLLGC